MIVYAESNFVLELALGQEQAAVAAAILVLAEQQKIDLVLPAFALGEPFATVTQRGRERQRLAASLKEHLRQLHRSVPHRQDAVVLQDAPRVLVEIVDREFALLNSTTERLLLAGRSLVLDVAVFRLALQYRARHGLQPQDSIVLASVMHDLRQQDTSARKCFISRNWKDFGSPGIAADLSAHSCRYEEGFDAGLAYIRAHGS